MDVSISSPSGEGGGVLDWTKRQGFSITFPLILLQAKAGGK